MFHSEASPIFCMCLYGIEIAVKQTGALQYGVPLCMYMVNCLENELCVVIKTVLPYSEVMLSFRVFNQCAGNLVLVTEGFQA